MSGLAPEIGRSDFPVGYGAAVAPNFDRFRAGSALWAASGAPLRVVKFGEVVKLTLFGYQPCQSTMCLREDVLKGKCRSEPNVK
jgi:hypothetical protein